MAPRSVNCYLCNNNFEKTKNCEYFCKQMMLMTSDCTGFKLDEVEVSIKSNAHILHVCSIFTERNTLGDLIQAVSTKLYGKLDDPI